MKVVILAGGYGTRISEETHLRPKPMVEIGGYPILWHIMKIYSAYGFRDFVICLGYKSDVIKHYFLNYYLHHSDITIDFGKKNEQIVHNNPVEPWKVTLVETGDGTLTGGRVKRIRNYIGDHPFMMTYGDGVADINVRELVKCHRSRGKLATLTATQPLGRFGALKLSADDRVEKFEEKVQGDGGWINAGFFVLQPEVFDYIEGDHTVFEKEPLERLAAEGQLTAFKHAGFWKPMDTLRDKNDLEALWASGEAPWKCW